MYTFNIQKQPFEYFYAVILHIYENFIEHALKGIIDHTEDNHTAVHFRGVYLAY